MKQNTQRVIFGLLIFTGFALTYANMSNKFDFDFGWNLRFGKEIIEQGKFPYLNTYSYPVYGTPYVNLGWGGNILEWLLHRTFGYPSLLFVMSVIVWAAFLLIPKIFDIRLSVLSVLISLFGIWSVQHIIMRLATLSPFFVFLLLHSLKHLNTKKSYLWWPVIIWIWSFLHGSWILGLIIISVYLMIEIFKRIFKSLPIWNAENILTDKTLIYSVLSFLGSLLIINLNPYGLHIWPEVFKSFIPASTSLISEFFPSYTYPIFIRPIIFVLFGLVALLISWQHKTVKLADIVLFMALFTSAFLYKRQALYAVFFSVAILANFFNHNYQSFFTKIWIWLGTRIQKVLIYLIVLVLIILNTTYFLKTNWSINVWKDKALLESSFEPYEAVQFLKQEIKSNTKIFNEFSWGSYLNYELPTALVYIDGRGIATSKFNNSETEMERYFKILNSSTGIKKIENLKTNYIFLKQPNTSYSNPPNILNRLIFSKEEIETYRSTNESPLFYSLQNNPNWKQIYSDKSAIIWKRTIN